MTNDAGEWSQLALHDNVANPGLTSQDTGAREQAQGGRTDRLRTLGSVKFVRAPLAPNPIDGTLAVEGQIRVSERPRSPYNWGSSQER